MNTTDTDSLTERGESILRDAYKRWESRDVQINIPFAIPEKNADSVLEHVVEVGVGYKFELNMRPHEDRHFKLLLTKDTAMFETNGYAFTREAMRELLPFLRKWCEGK